MDVGLNVVTGSSRGIGRATAEIFGREGAFVDVTYHNRASAPQRWRRESVSAVAKRWSHR
jgi:NAD(P)-dependent dehydrogenase (short-subunit alcohol dehydrogenase family)